MALLDRLSVEGQQDAKFVKSNLTTVNLSNFKTLIDDLIEKIEAVTYSEINLITQERCFYDLNKIVRKRNAIFREISKIQENYNSSKDVFEFFLNTSDELLELIGNFQSIIASIQSNYLRKKYVSKDCSFIEKAIGAEAGKGRDIKSILEDFKEFFLG